MNNASTTTLPLTWTREFKHSFFATRFLPTALARIFHTVSTAASQSGMSTTLRLFGLLDILCNMPSSPSLRAPCIHTRLRRLATKPYEISGLGLRPLIKCYHQQHQHIAKGPADFAGRTLEALNISVEIYDGTVDNLPAAGPLLLAANHPFGAVEGLVLAALCTQVRPDLKILVNHMLYRIPELRPLFVPVNVFNAKGCKDNIPGLRSALLHLKGGGALAVFPSGTVSHWHMRERRVVDPEWNSLIGRLARIAGAAVVPFYFEGRNSALFHAAGCIYRMPPPRCFRF